MMVYISALSSSFILFLLSCLHFFWAIGGQWGFAQALPTNATGERVLNPSSVDCIVVGIGLLCFGLLVLARRDIVQLPLPTWLKNNVLWCIAGIFFLRAMGDFYYVGFFKSITNTAFASLDTLYYSPLCLMLAVLLGIVQWKH
jgi:hypothetical protein